MASSENSGSSGKVSYMPGVYPVRTNIGGKVQNEGIITLQAGDVIAGRFEIRDQIGIGGMGVVYRAHDHNRGDDIAIKVMLPELAANESAKQRFISEAKVSMKLAHQNIVNTFDVLADDALLFITMELLEGRSLRQDMERRKGIRQPYAETEALDIVRPLCDALEYAHDYTVHRDIKPENVWLTTKDRVKLMDFGLSRLLTGSQMSKSTTVLGTAYYMAPEQLVPSKEVDNRADQYALGVMLYELLTGQVPTGRSKSVRQLRSDVSATVSDAIDRALEPDPNDRFSDVHSFAEALGGTKQLKSPPSVQKTIATAGGFAALMGWIDKHRLLASVGCVLWAGVLVLSNMVRQDSIRQSQLAWEKWQIEMNAAFDQAQNTKGDADARARAWAQFLAGYAKDNPFTLDDDKLRAKAETNRQGAEEEKKALLAAKQQRVMAIQQWQMTRAYGAPPQYVQQPQYARAPQYAQQPQYAPQPQYQPPPQPAQKTAEQEAGLMILNRMLR